MRMTCGLEGEGLVAGVVGPHFRRIGRERGLGGDRGGERLVIDRDQLGRVLRLVRGFGDDEGDGVADIADAILRQ
jgi:hypothetical protein